MEGCATLGFNQSSNNYNEKSELLDSINADLRARQAIPSSQSVHSAAGDCGRRYPYLFNFFLTNLVLLLLTL